MNTGRDTSSGASRDTSHGKGPMIGDSVVVMGYKQRTDGGNEEPGIINGVVENPTAEELELERQTREKVDKLDVSQGRTATPRPSLVGQQPILTADVSPCRVDIAVFPYRGDHRNLRDVPFFTSRDKGIEYFEAIEPKPTDGAVGCVAYYPEVVDLKHDAKMRAERAAKKEAALRPKQQDAQRNVQHDVQHDGRHDKK